MNYPDTFFDAFMYPLEAVSLTAKRRRLMPRASGDVLELGAGTGANLEFYDPRDIRTLTVTDRTLTERLHERAEGFRARAGVRNGEIRLVEADVDSLPFPSQSFDTAVFTLVFCSVPEQARALREVRRVLRPGGRILFIEHVRPHGVGGHLADGVNPIWHAATGECNVNRDTAAAIERAGFSMEELRVSGGGFLIEGIAVDGDGWT